MACGVDPLVSEAVSKLADLVIYVAQTTANFKPQLKTLQSTLDKIHPIIYEMQDLDRKLDRTKQESMVFIDELQEAQKLVEKCLKIKRNYIKKFTHSLKLKDVDNKLVRFFQIDVQVHQSRDIKRTLVEVMDVSGKMSNLSMRMDEIVRTVSGFNSMSSSRDDEIIRWRLGWRVPLLPVGIVAFEEPLKKLKYKVLADDGQDLMDCDGGFDDGSVVVVSAPGGCGKTTLVTMLCHDLEIQAKFRDNIFFVTVSETPNFMVIVNDLFSPNSFGQVVAFQSDEDAKNKLANFMVERVSCPLLLVLDDVWSEAFIDNFKFKMEGYKIVVTSRTIFQKYDVFRYEPLSDHDAKTLFSRSAFSGDRAKPNFVIKNPDFVNKMVKCCKKHPLTLSVVGSSLNGKDESVWRSMLNSLSQGQSVLDLNKEVLNRLERSFGALDDDFKQCFLDLGLFPEDQRIPATALLNIWMHLYHHDEEGTDTLAKLFELSYRNLVSFTTTRKDSSVIVNFCEQQFVTQHDLLRELAIQLTRKEPIALRKRLVIDARGKDLPTSLEQLQQPMHTRILSISTEGSFPPNLCSMKFPNVEVLVLNFLSKSCSFPYFIQEMKKLMVLNVTNYGLYPMELENFNLLGSLSNLTRIRLERVAISSLSRSILELANLQKVSFVMCRISNAFEKLDSEKVNSWPRLVEIEMDYCHDLVEFPSVFCNSVYLKKLNITNCNEMCGLSEELGRLESLEILSLRSCTKLAKLPESIVRLKKLAILDISDCLSLSELPDRIGELSGLRTIHMKGCTGVVELPPSVEELPHLEVVCNEEISYQWMDYPNATINVVEEDRFGTLMKII